MIKSVKSGFTLIEVMITIVLLATGVIAVYNAFSVSLRGLNYYSDYLCVFPLIDDKFMCAQNALSSSGRVEDRDAGGNFRIGNRDFTWNVAYSLEDEVNNAEVLSRLYRINLYVMFYSGRKQVNLSRTGYALYEPAK